jgi:proton glutamate symport protein
MAESAPVRNPPSEQPDAAGKHAALVATRSGDNPPAAQDRKRGVGLPVLILIGALLGVCVGVVFGERARILEPVGSAYALMLQIAVYPYLLCALLVGLGRLTPGMARRLFAASWGPYLFMWAVTLGSIWLLARAIPPTPPPSVVQASVGQLAPSLLDLLIPANLVQAIGRNYVPAVVIFAIVYGLAIHKVERKGPLLDVLNAIQVASVTLWRWVVRFAPIGVFALFAAFAGSVEPAHLAGLLLYIGLFLAGTLLLAFVVLPSVMAAVAPVGHRELLKELQPALVLAFVTTLSVVALPFVQQAAERAATLADCPEGEERTDVIKTTLSLSYALAQLGNYFIYLFILYAAYNYKVELTLPERLMLPFWTLLSGLGSPSATVDGVIFLSNWLHLPSGALDLFLETWTITRYGQVLVSVMGFGFATILIPLIYFSKLKIQPSHRLLKAALSFALLAIVVIGATALRPLLQRPPDNRLTRLVLDPVLVHDVKATLYRPGTTGPKPLGIVPTLSTIQSSGVLRVGYNPNIIPFCYWNAQGDLVGFDVAYAYRLARDLNVTLELIPFEWTTIAADLRERRFDIAIGGIYETDDRLQTLTVSNFYYESPPAMIVRSGVVHDFLSRSAIMNLPQLRVAVFDDPVVVQMLRFLLPNARAEIVPNYDHPPPITDQIDGAFWTLQQAGAWAEVHPGFTAVAPTGMGGPILFVYLMPPGADSLRQYINQWLELQTSNGFRAAQLDYWIDGKPRKDPQPRWNLLDALLGVNSR